MPVAANPGSVCHEFSPDPFFLREVMFSAAQVRNASGIVAAGCGILLIMRSLIAPFLLLVGLVYLIGAIVIFVLFRKTDPFCLAIAGISLGLFIGMFFAPLWIAEFSPHTAEEHLHLAERYANRGQLFGNHTQAVKHYLEAAQGGNADAQVRLGEVYLFGHYGQTKSKEEAIRWLTAAADQGNQSAKNTLAVIESSERN